jgi:aromatic ring-opening dioxygenase LigB subunit
MLATVTRAGMEELGRLFAAARPDAVIVATPHNVHIANALGVIVAGRIAGQLAGAPPSVALDLPSANDLAWLLLEAFAAAEVPSVGVSFGSNDPETAVAPMDWGVLIPLWFMGGRDDPPIPLVVVTPARDLSAAAHIAAGAAIANAAAEFGRRVAFIASAKKYDTLIRKLVRTNTLERLSEIPPELVEEAKADSWWQMLMLHGATKGWKGRLISYEAPTYFGMLTAAYLPG